MHLKIQLYNDEITPGNALAHANKRKLVAYYWAIGQCGPSLHREDNWHHICCLRSVLVKRIRGGNAQLFKKVASLFFLEPCSLNKGVLMRFRGNEHRVLFGKLSNIIGDELALKQLWSVKGSAGTLLCLKCQNLVDTKSTLGVHSSGLVPHCQPSLSGIRLHTDASILKNASYLQKQHGTMSKARFERLEQGLGLSLAPEGPLWDEAWCRECLEGGPITSTSFDWMHIFLVSGVWNHESGFLPLTLVGTAFTFFSCCFFFQPVTASHMQCTMHLRCDALHDHGITSKTIMGYIADVKFPAKVTAKGGSGAQTFKRTPRSGEIKASSSEGLSLYPVLRLLVSGLVPNPTGYLAQCATSQTCLAVEKSATRLLRCVVFKFIESF